MNKIFNADLYRMFSKKWIRIGSLCMVALSLVFILIQYSAMDYKVSVDRVIFLPMSFYGIITAALVSMFIGDDFSDGMIKNKIIAGESRKTIYISSLLVSSLGCLTIYFLMLIVTIGLGINMFEVNVMAGTIIEYIILGLFTCIVYSCIFTFISMTTGNKSVAAVISMILAFAMLFLCLHTNQILTQTQIKDGVANPAYTAGIKRVVYELLHDMNPTGQAAQLSSMYCLNTFRYICVDLIWILATTLGGVFVFSKKDI